MAGPFLTHVGRSIDVPFMIRGADGSVDTTTPAVVASANPAVTVGVRHDNNRVAFVDGKSEAVFANVDVSATIGGLLFHDAFLVKVDSAPNQGAVIVGDTASAEYPTPSSR